MRRFTKAEIEGAYVAANKISSRLHDQIDDAAEQHNTEAAAISCVLFGDLARELIACGWTSPDLISDVLRACGDSSGGAA